MKTLKPALALLAAVALFAPMMAAATPADECDAAITDVRAAADASPGRMMNAQIATAIQNAFHACPEDGGKFTIPASFDEAYMTNLPGTADANNCKQETVEMENVLMQYAILLAGQPIGPVVGVGKGYASWNGHLHGMDAKDRLENGFWAKSDRTAGLYLLNQELGSAFGNARVGCAAEGTELCWASGYAALSGSTERFGVVASGLWKACL